VVIEISKVEVELPAAGAWWGKYARREKEDLAMDIQMPGELTCVWLFLYLVPSLSPKPLHLPVALSSSLCQSRLSLLAA